MYVFPIRCLIKLKRGMFEMLHNAHTTVAVRCLCVLLNISRQPPHRWWKNRPENPSSAWRLRRIKENTSVVTSCVFSNKPSQNVTCVNVSETRSAIQSCVTWQHWSKTMTSSHDMFTVDLYLLRYINCRWQLGTVFVYRSGEANSSSNTPTDSNPSTHHPPSMGR